MLIHGEATDETDDGGRFIEGATMLLLVNTSDDEVGFTLPIIDAEGARPGDHGRMMKGVPNEAAEVSRDRGLGTCSVHHCEQEQDLSDVFRMGVL